MSRHRTLTAVAELALAGASVVAAVSLERLFTDTSFLPELLVMVIGSHAVAVVCRRANLAMAWATVASVVTMIVLGTALFYPEASAAIVPTRETATVLTDDLREAWRVFSEDSAPVPPLRGFVVTAAVVLWYGAFLADWAAFRLRSPLEAIAPASAVFVFGSLLGVDRNAVAHGTLFALGVGGVLLTLRAERQAREEVWIAGREGDGARTTLGVGAVLGVAVIAIGAAAAPMVPGADDNPLIDVTELNRGPQTRAVVSPLVEVSASLVEQPDLELFTVEVDPEDRDYWRLMALTTFENDIWRRSSNFSEARGSVGSDLDPDVARREVEQTITATGLGNIYLPAAYEVSDVRDNGGIELEYEVATGALVVARGLDSVPPGFTYTVASQVPDFTPETLPASAAGGLGGDFVAEHTQLPPPCGPGQTAADDGCWPASVTQLARAVTAGATTDHERVLALQGHFLDPANFTYDLDVALQHDVRDMEDFLFVTRRGYCEQFAATFAAMARSLGIPARVAVGFTWGDWDPDREAYVVRGEHAHAWPEVYFADTGWVVFDPTPGRSRPHDGDVTGLTSPAQAGDAPVVPPATVTVPAPEPTTGPGNGSAPAPDPADATPTTSGAVVATDDAGGAGLPRAALWGLVGLAAGIAVAGTVPALRWLRRRRRLTRVAADPAGRGELAWDDAVAALGLVGHAPAAHQTPHEFAEQVARSRRELGPVDHLAEAVTTLRYDRPADPVSPARTAAAASAEIVRTCHGVAGRRRVLLAAIDPRDLRG